MKEKSNKLYPSLNYDWNDAHSPQLEKLTNVELVQEVAHFAGVTSDVTSKGGLKNALVAAIDGYIDGVSQRVRQCTEAEDNEALDRASKKANELSDALSDLIGHPGLEERVEQSIRNCGTLYEHKGGKPLVDILQARRNIFQPFREILVDLQVCTEREINRKPKPTYIDEFEGDNAVRLDTDEELEQEMQLWRKRSKERKLPKDYALKMLLEAIRPYWVKNSFHPFSEGMYHKDQRQTISNLVDAIEAITSRLDPSVTRQRIVNTIRNMRMLDSSNASS